jgi:hypothetical protein
MIQAPMMRVLTDPRLFPVVLIALDLLAAGRYALDNDWRRAIYWLAAGVLTLMVTI